MYIPKLYSSSDPNLCSEIIAHFPLATVITLKNGEPYANHLPLILSSDRKTLIGHMARANPQWQAMSDGQTVLCVFAGPDSYVSPQWYPSLALGENHVPTWNYASIHVYGKASVIDSRRGEQDFSRFKNLLETSVRTFETGMPKPWAMELPEDFERKLMDAIIGFEISIDRMEGKFKLSQNRSIQDREGVIKSVDGETGDMMRRWYAGE